MSLADGLTTDPGAMMWRLAAGTERTILRLALGAATTLAAVCMYSPEAGASCPQPLEDRYDPGEVVTIVGSRSAPCRERDISTVRRADPT